VKESSLVLDEALLDGADLRRGIGDMGDGDFGGGEEGFAGWGVRMFAEGVEEEVGGIGGGLLPGEEGVGVRTGEGDETLVGSFVAAEEALGFERSEVEAVEERTIAVG
jgi:hypothetical protein